MKQEKIDRDIKNAEEQKKVNEEKTKVEAEKLKTQEEEKTKVETTKILVEAEKLKQEKIKQEQADLQKNITLCSNKWKELLLEKWSGFDSWVYPSQENHFNSKMNKCIVKFGIISPQNMIVTLYDWYEKSSLWIFAMNFWSAPNFCSVWNKKCSTLEWFESLSKVYMEN